MKLSRIILAILVWFLLSLATTFAQDSSLKSPKVIKSKGSEINLLMLDVASIEAGQESVLIIVVFRGTEDTEEDVIKRRSHSVRAYFIDVNKTRDSSNLVVAASTETGKYKYGGIEIYVKGELYEVLTEYKNDDLGLGPIGPEDEDDEETRKIRKLLYPWHYDHENWKYRDNGVSPSGQVGNKVDHNSNNSQRAGDIAVWNGARC